MIDNKEKCVEQIWTLEDLMKLVTPAGESSTLETILTQTAYRTRGDRGH